MQKLKRKYIDFFMWLFLVILWNYGYPEASPFYDVIVAIILFLVFILIKKLKF